MKELPVLADWVNANDGVVRAGKRTIVEEYSTTCDEIRQDFLIARKPRGKGNPILELAIKNVEITECGTDDAIALRINTGGLSTGTYILNVKAGKESMHYRMIISK